MIHWPHLAQVLRDLREERWLSQLEVAAQTVGTGTYVGEKTISSFETGDRTDRIRLSQLVSLCEAYGITLAQFVALIKERRALGETA